MGTKQGARGGKAVGDGRRGVAWEGGTGKAGRTGLRRSAMALACSAVGVALGLGCCGDALAGAFSLDNGIEGQWTLNASLGGSWRASSRDPALVAVGNGGTGGTSNDDGNLNYGRRAAFSTIANLSGELKLKHDNAGVVLGAKGWYDFTLKNGSVPHGSFANAYQPGARLSDTGFDALSKFSGLELANAYGFASFDVGDGKTLGLKVGNHVVNWGESLFVAGVNQFGVFDVPAANRPGAQVKDILLPIPQLSVSLDLGGGLSLEALYQFKWRKTILDGCGTYWSLTDSLNCPSGAMVGGNLSDQVLFSGAPLEPGGPAFNFRMGRAPDLTPGNSGQYGFAARYLAASIDTEFGAYFANFHQRTPIVSVLKEPSPFPGSVWNGSVLPPLQFLWDWSAKNLRVFGLSASTVVGGWSLFGEVSHTTGIPVQINGVDLLSGAAAGVGPQAALAGMARGSLFHGFDRKDKTQAQVSALKIFSTVAGAESLTLLGEVAAQRWSGIGDPNTGTRYGRGFSFGFAQTASIPCAATGNINPSFCENAGFFTGSAWGYRALAELSYPNVFAGVNLKPRLFFSHDVNGYSADGSFTQDRRVLALGVKADYNKRYSFDLSFTRYNRNAKYDVLHDRDFFSAVAAIQF